MTQVDQAAFSCAACGKQFRWKSELAGKTVKCKCGNPLKVPGGPGGGGARPANPAGPGLAAAARSAEVRPKHADDGDGDLDGLYALAAEAERQSSSEESASLACPGCRAALPAGSVLCVSCGTDLRTGRRATVAAVPVHAPVVAPAASRGGGGGGASAGVIPMWGVRPRGPQDAAAGARGFTSENLIYEGSKFRNVFLPTILIAVGLCFYVGQLALAQGPGERFAAAGFAVFILLNAFVDAVLIFAALIFCAKFLDMGFGAIGPAVLKIFAIAIGPTALGDILIHVLAKPLGTFGAVVAGGVVAIVLYYTLIKVFFDLDLGETILLTGIIYVLQRWVKFLLVMGLIASFMGRGGDDDDGGADGGSDADEVGALLGVDTGSEIQPLDPSAVFKPRPFNDRDNNAPIAPDEDPRVISGIMEEVYKELGIDQKFGNEDTYNRVHTEASLRSTTMPAEKKKQYIDKADREQEKSELVSLFVDAHMDEIASRAEGARAPYQATYEEALRKAEPLTPEQVKAELVTQRAAAKVRAAAQEKKWAAESAKKAEAARQAARAAAVQDGFDVDPNEPAAPAVPAVPAVPGAPDADADMDDEDAPDAADAPETPGTLDDGF